MVEPNSSDNGATVLKLTQLSGRTAPQATRLARTDAALREHLRQVLFGGARQAWWPAVQEWLGKFDGLDSMVDDSSDLPAHQVLQVFGARMRESDLVIAENLGCCDFLCWRAHPVNDRLERCGTAWDWRSTPLCDFMAAAPYVMYQSDREHPEPMQTVAWLLSRLTGSPYLVSTP